ncbi:PPP1R8 [Lepeophtheirus salmonis]|uniref:PPP1R8 n=1 Tax=Lepeophtheirus salmonis TaxID=72036 RepID=A0A7R8H8N4_LEPSM|nr:PPP1R8 [Lepeophtheirus salmonis]CAF2942902.1 PPP1R8 [Lepeophtheirus salmonis]
MSNHYDIPAWAGKPPTGLHLDKCYLFGRNTQLNDFCIDHQSCSRVHAALVYHKHLQRAFLVDLGSTHGTFVGSVRIEGKKPTQLPVDTRFHFGASTRMYIIRERPQTGSRPIMEEIEKSTADGSGGLLGLPETETELDILPNESSNTPNKKRKKTRIVFAEDEDVINPEDIDPSVGRFRNLVETTIIPKRNKNSIWVSWDLPLGPSHLAGYSATLSYKLGLPLPNPAPDIEIAPTVTEEPIVPQVQPSAPVSFEEEDPDEPKKKKYAKEAWPGRKPTPSLLV